MCRFISFFHRPDNGDVAVYDLTSHGNTEQHLNLNLNLWREGHWLPDGNLGCRTDKDRTSSEKCNERILARYGNFWNFYSWCIKQNVICSGGLDLSGCDLSKVKIPTKFKNKIIY